MDLLLFVGGGGPTPPERLLVDARRSAARDLLVQVQSLPYITRCIVITDAPEWAATLPHVQVDADPVGPDAPPFHFGARLVDVCTRYQVASALVMGGGSAPLLTAQALDDALAPLLAADAASVVVTNNLHSSDWTAFAPVAPLAAHAARVHRDNALAWVLARELGYRAHVPARSAATQFDLDTPADLALLARHPAAGAHVRAAAAAAPSLRVDDALAVLRTPGRQVMLAGRVASSVCAQVEARTQVWTRVFSEERGMAASGRLARGEVRSVLGLLLADYGPAGFWERVGAFGDLLIFDTRVLMAARGWPPAGERYASDMGRLEWIADPYWRAFTQAALALPQPVLLGGHSLVSGGVLALLEMLET